MVDLLSVFSAVIIVVVCVPTFLLVVGRMIAFFTSFGATGTVTLEPEGERKGKGLIVYEPGATTLTKKVAESIGGELLSRGFEVKISGIRSAEARDPAGYDLLVLGTPTYLGRPTGPFKKYVRKLRPANGQVVGVYLTGTRGAPAVGLVPKAFLDSMKKPFEESGVRAKEMAFVGYNPFDYPVFISSLLDPPAAPAEN